MTREEAIKHFEPYIGNECYTDYHQEACGMAISALRAQQAPLDRSRWEGCDYCTHNKDNVELCPMLSHDESDCDRGMYIHRGCLVSNSGEFQYVKIDFCPMCGRPLTEAAWAELERRINGGTTD